MKTSEGRWQRARKTYTGAAGATADDVGRGAGLGVLLAVTGQMVV